MDKDNFIKVAREARKAARRRRVLMAEFHTFCSGGAIAFTGLLLAVAYCLLTHRIAV